MKQVKNVSIRIRLTVQEREQLKDLAKASNISVAKLLTNGYLNRKK